MRKSNIDRYSTPNALDESIPFATWGRGEARFLSDRGWFARSNRSLVCQRVSGKCTPTAKAAEGVDESHAKGTPPEEQEKVRGDKIDTFAKQAITICTRREKKRKRKPKHLLGLHETWNDTLLLPSSPRLPPSRSQTE